ncbi:MAG: hypothetical protein IT289_12715 [Oligoflexia bacterium]|nr:hypothetical protein [Oligoflexia bacterium]
MSVPIAELRAWGSKSLDRLDLSRPSNTIKTYLIDSKGLITPVTLTLSGLEDVGYRINGFKALRGKVEVNGEFEGEKLNGGNVIIVNPYCFLN